MLYLIELVLIISVMVHTNCQTSSTKDVITSTLVPTEVVTPDPLVASDKPVIEEPKIYCDSPGPIPNGWIDTTENLPLKISPVGRSIVYRCNKNMKLIGVSSASCEKNGRWSNSPPDCLSPCIVPMVEYGVVRNESSRPTVSHGGKLTFECIESYQPAHGLATSICHNGTWNVIPRCIPGPRENCDIPEIPKGMFIQLDGKNVTNNQTYVIGTEILYKCSNPNDQLVDNIGSVAEHSRHICDAETRKWKGILHKCEPTCFSLDYNIRVKLVDTDEPKLRNITYDGAILNGERYKIGTKAFVYCESAENVIHPTAVANYSQVCQSNGTWRANFPICGPSVAGRLKFSTILILLACLASGFIFLLALVSVGKKYGYFSRTPADANNQNSNNKNGNDAQGMRAELLRQIGRQSFYSLDETSAGGDRGYATIHRPATIRRPSGLAVHYGRERPTSQYGKLG